MGEYSKIEWCDHTFNPWIGCQKVSPGCDHCYAEAMMEHRYKRVKWGPHGERQRTAEQNWKKPIQWNAQSHKFGKEYGRRARVFCASLADVFDNQVDASWRSDLFALIRRCRKLDWLVLTKRPENIEKMLPSDWGDGYSNVWLGTLPRIRRGSICGGSV
jgi:protein gp37